MINKKRNLKFILLGSLSILLISLIVLTNYILNTDIINISDISDDVILDNNSNIISNTTESSMVLTQFTGKEILESSLFVVGNSDFKFICEDLSDNTAAIIGYEGTASSITIPKTLDSKEVIKITNNTFFSNHYLKAVNFLSGHEITLESRAFVNCSNLTSVTFTPSEHYSSYISLNNVDDYDYKYITAPKDAFLYCPFKLTSAIPNSNPDVNPPADTTGPSATISYNTYSPTNKDVTVTVSANESIRPVSGWKTISNTTLSRTFSENGPYSITLIDTSGNSSYEKFTISNIDKTPIETSVNYSRSLNSDKQTFRSVDVKIISSEYIAKIKDSNEKIYTRGDTPENWNHGVTDLEFLSKTYRENAYETITLYDKAGNATPVVIHITDIDKVKPQITITPVYNGILNEETGNTKGTATVTLTANEDIYMGAYTEIENMNPGWEQIDSITLRKTYTDNNEEIVHIRDIAGNYVPTKVIVDKLDNTAPKVDINYSTTDPTNKDVTVTMTFDEKVKDLNTNGISGWTLSEDKLEATKIFSDNVELETIVISDILGNYDSHTVTIENIDKTPPVLTVRNNYLEASNLTQAVISSNESISKIVNSTGWLLTNPFIITSKLYDKNTTETIIVEDFAGNRSSIDVLITEIQEKDEDMIMPAVIYHTSSNEEPTNQPITITLHFNKPIVSVDSDIDTVTDDLLPWDISSDKLSATRELTKYNLDVITITDELGNTGQYGLIVSNLDSVSPQLSNIVYSTTNPTNENVIVTIDLDEQITLTDEQKSSGWKLQKKDGIREFRLLKEYSSNTSELLTVTDLVGNESSVQIDINNIDKSVEYLETTFSTTELTNKDVTVTIHSNEELEPIDSWTLSNDKKQLTKKYTSNIVENIIIKDIVGNTHNVPISITNINLNLPNIKQEYKLLTDENNIQTMLVTLTSDRPIKPVEGWEISEDKTVLTKIYYNNISDTILIEDLLGNSMNVEILIDSLTNVSGDSTPPELTATYTLQEDNSILMTIVSNEPIQQLDGWEISENQLNLTKTFNYNYFELLQVSDLHNNSTSILAEINTLDNEFDLKGDADLNNKIDLTDLLLLKRHLVYMDTNEFFSWYLSDEKQQLMDLDNNSTLDNNDLLLLKSMILENMTN